MLDRFRFLAIILFQKNFYFIVANPQLTPNMPVENMFDVDSQILTMASASKEWTEMVELVVFDVPKMYLELLRLLVENTILD